MKKRTSENVKMFGCYATPTLMREFQSTARAQDLSMSQLFRIVARREIRRHNKEVAAEQ
jgi:hypothetical protein